MSPNFTALLLTGIAFSVVVLGFMAWRFGVANMMVFVAMASLPQAVMDFLPPSSPATTNTPAIPTLGVHLHFFGWMGMCGTCVFLAKGILARPGKDLLSQPCLGWRVPMATGIIAVALDLFIDPMAVVAGYWVWLVPGEVYFGIPLLNFVGWFVLMFLAPLAGS